LVGWRFGERAGSLGEPGVQYTQLLCKIQAASATTTAINTH